MPNILEKFAKMATENAPGQEARHDDGHLHTIMVGDVLPGEPVDFSHGDVDAHAPTPGAREIWNEGFDAGGCQAYTEYRGLAEIRNGVARQLAAFTGNPVDPVNELIIAPGTQGALFLALGATVDTGTKVAIVEPDYFANRKLVTFFGGTILPVGLRYQGAGDEGGLDLEALEKAFQGGAEVLVFSNPNNPTGFVYSQHEIQAMAKLAAQYNVTVVADQLYSRLLYSDAQFTHFRACETCPENVITIMGPSKTESLSGFRLGVAFGTAAIVDRMEKLQAIVSLRAAGYNQRVLETWFNEPEGWMADRVAQHQAIRNDLLQIFNSAGLPTATPHAGSYLFPRLPELTVSPVEFVRLLRLQAGVIVTPGSEFAPWTADSIRLNFSQDHAKAVAAAKRIVTMVERYKQ